MTPFLPPVGPFTCLLALLALGTRRRPEPEGDRFLILQSEREQEIPSFLDELEVHAKIKEIRLLPAAGMPEGSTLRRTAELLAGLWRG